LAFSHLTSHPCLILTKISPRLLATPIARGITRGENIINVDAGVDIEAGALPYFRNDCCLKASDLNKSATQKKPRTRSPMCLTPLGPMQTAMKNLNLNSGLMV
jgi:hypothetical protein